jgi:AcrR family transcriptional regulator
MTVEFLWGERARPTRGPKPAMTLERIAEAAIAIADTEGLAAVSMQRVAAELGFTKMSLYRYLPGKAELVALMLERAIGEAPALATTDWRTALSEWTGLLLDAYVRHPWAAEATGGTRPVGPNEMSWMERALAALPAAGLAGTERLDAVAVLAGHARVSAALVASQQREADFGAAIGAVLREHADRFPAVAAAMADGAGGGAAGGQEQSFAFGLARVLDGLQVLIDQRNAVA